ncbi:MAG TPA: hypothetical protein VGE21_09655 [Flavobacteriales bacterium]
MTATPELLQELTLATLRRMNEDLPAAERRNFDPGTPIIGDSGVLDSLGLANFLVGMEEAVEERFGTSVSLTDQDLFELFTEDDITVQAFAQRLSTKLQA